MKNPVLIAMMMVLDVIVVSLVAAIAIMLGPLTAIWLLLDSEVGPVPDDMTRYLCIAVMIAGVVFWMVIFDLLGG